YVAWARFFDTQILISRSTDCGNSFVGPVTVSDINGVQWPVPCVGPNSEVYVAWVQFSPGAIRFDRSMDGGETFGSDITIQNATFVYGYINGNITVFSFPAMDVDITGGPNNGNIYVVYMDYSSGYTDMDIYFTRSTDGGNTWSAKVRINDDTLNNGCDQFHPWLTVAPDGSIIVVFLDRRLDPGNLWMDLYMTTSIDGGNTWSVNERITTVSSDPTAGLKSLSLNPSPFPIKINQPEILAGRAGLLGEYIGVTASSIDNIHPIWTDTRLGNQDVFTGFRISPSVEEGASYKVKNYDMRVFPDPFVKNLRIDYSLAEKEDIRFFLYDITGREVSNGRFYVKERRGSFVWNSKELPSGTYFLHLKISHFSKTFTLHKIK
ncbi:MAG: T9SS type A sorting domain-containing protein, partial [Candidatus Cloacimonadota bacterium]